MTRNGIVLEVRGDEALVSLTGAEECETCSAKGTCFTLSGRKRRRDRVWMPNEAEAEANDMVELELAPATALRVIAITFLVPVLLLLAGYILVYAGDDGQRAIGAGAGLAVGIVIALLVNRKFRSDGSAGLTMVRVIPKDECE